MVGVGFEFEIDYDTEEESNEKRFYTMSSRGPEGNAAGERKVQFSNDIERNEMEMALKKREDASKRLGGLFVEEVGSELESGVPSNDSVDEEEDDDDDDDDEDDDEMKPKLAQEQVVGDVAVTDSSADLANFDGDCTLDKSMDNDDSPLFHLSSEPASGNAPSGPTQPSSPPRFEVPDICIPLKRLESVQSKFVNLEAGIVDCVDAVTRQDRVNRATVQELFAVLTHRLEQTEKRCRILQKSTRELLECHKSSSVREARLESHCALLSSELANAYRLLPRLVRSHPGSTHARKIRESVNQVEAELEYTAAQLQLPESTRSPTELTAAIQEVSDLLFSHTFDRNRRSHSN